jgi:SAM-dependent methyltransferase
VHVFYGPEQAAIHHARFGDLARRAAEVVLAELRAAGLHTGQIVDLGAGSGIFARIASDAGYQVVGVDVSADMIDLARTNAPAASFVVGSVHDFDLPERVGAVTALGEVLNYATDGRAGLDAVGRLAARVREALLPGGFFLFDVSTPGRGGPTGRVDRFHDDDAGEWALGMHAVEHNGVLERAITTFARDGDGYRRVDEHHVLRLYDGDAVVQVLEAAGFTVDVRDGYGEPATFPGWQVFMCRRRDGRGSW